ncbi:outer membrane beta-barrel protein [Bacteroidota bacterium]
MKGNKMSTFKKLFATLVLVLFVTSVSFAQVNKNYDGVKPECKKGSHALVFMYSPFVSGSLSPVFSGNASSYNDTLNSNTVALYGAGYRYWVSDQFSLGGGISFGMDNVNATFAGGTAESKATTYGINVEGLYQFKPMYSIAPYIGLGVNFGMVDYTYDITTTTGGTSSTNSYANSGNAFGGGLGVGFDWYFTEGMSLGGRYTIGVRSYSAPEYTYTSGAVSTTYTGPDRMVLGTSAASIYLNVHLPY